MGMESPQPIPPQESHKDTPPSDSERVIGTKEVADFSVFLGEGFDNEFFADKMETFPRDKIFEGWNTFLHSEGDEGLKSKTIETSSFDKIINKLTGLSDTPTMFPVFIQGLQSYYVNIGISHAHVTPERMQRFYDYMSGATN